MKAIVFNPELSKPVIEEWPYPIPGPNEVVVKIHSAALNHRDVNIKNSPYTKDKFVFGSDGAGTIFQVGENVEDVMVGDEVILNTYISCLKCEDCLSGNHTFCSSGRVLGGLAWPGTFAEYVKVPAQNVAKKPKHLSFTLSAALALSFGTAWRALFSKAKIKPGDSLLIQGIGGGVSLYCLQIAVAFGCHVIVTSSSNQKIEAAIKMGAVAGINYKENNVLEEIKKVTNNKGVDIVVSSYGGSVPLSIDAAKFGGKIIQFAYLGDTLPTFEIDKIMMKQLSLMGTGDHTYQEFKQALNFIETHKVIPTISEVFSFNDFEKAFQLMEDGKQFGKIVLEIK
ncbi:alcohol dehydrogenase catalytic domain-containing protein [Fredinandcohnia humi]